MTAVKSYLTNFPMGMSTDIGIRNLPAIVTNAGRNIWIDSNGPGATLTSGNLGKRGTFQRPYATVASFLSATGAVQNNDTIWVKPGHVETISAAAGWAIGSASLTGVRVIGLGIGDERPQITFSTSTAATITLAGAGCALMNIIGICNINSLVSPVVVSAAGCSIVMEWRDVSAKEALRAILSTAGFKNGYIDLKYVGIAQSGVNVNAVRLVGSTGIRLNVDYFGATNSGGVVQFSTTACANIIVQGFSNNHSSSSGSNITVDTITGSSYISNIIDASTSTPGVKYTSSLN
jgi:hypothetical protein